MVVHSVLPRGGPPEVHLAAGPHRRRWWSVQPADVLLLLVPVAVVVTTLVLARRDSPAAVGGLGLVTVTPRLVLGGACLLSCSFAVALRQRAHSPVVLGVHVLVLLFVLHGLPGLLEQEPRFGTAYLHTGFSDVILKQHHPLPTYDARFSWPGFFSGAGLLAGASGVPAQSLLRWAPVLFEGLCILPVALIARAVTASRWLPWMAVWLYLLTNWVGQDYFSPQAMAYVLFLSVAGLVLRHLVQPRESRRRRRGRATTSSPEPGPGGHRPLRGPSALPWPVTSSRSAGLLVVATVVITAALSMSHQLTPVVLVVDLGALVLLRRCRVPALPLLTGLVVLGWISYGAVPFWSGHLSQLFMPGGLSESVNSNLAERLTGDPTHLLVVRIRLLLTAAVWLFALTGFWRLRRRLDPATGVLGALAAAPFAILPVQSYGGEAQLRVYLYTLPFMLTAGLVGWCGSGRPSLRGSVTLACAGLLLTPLFYVSRYGNESFEQVRPADLSALSYVYRVAPRGASVVIASPNVPWTYPSVNRYRIVSLKPVELTTRRPDQLPALGVANPRGIYLVITPSQVTYASSTYGLPTTWADTFERRIRQTRGFSLVFRDDGAAVYKVVPG